MFRFLNFKLLIAILTITRHIYSMDNQAVRMPEMDRILITADVPDFYIDFALDDVDPEDGLHPQIDRTILNLGLLVPFQRLQMACNDCRDLSLASQWKFSRRSPTHKCDVSLLRDGPDIDNDAFIAIHPGDAWFDESVDDNFQADIRAFTELGRRKTRELSSLVWRTTLLFGDDDEQSSTDD